MPSSAPGTSGIFRTSDGLYEFKVSQNQSATRFRREARLTVKKVAADPISAQNKEISASVIITYDEPKWGFSDSELGNFMTSLLSWHTAGTRAQILNGEL
jgi:hypothetical protein